MKKKTLHNKRTKTIVLVVIVATIVVVSIGFAILAWWVGNHPVMDSPEFTEVDTVYMLSPYKYRQEGQKPRKWNREIYCCDMDSITVVNWDSLTTKEKVDAISEAFIFELDDSVWDEYTEEEKLKILLDNSDVEWLH